MLTISASQIDDLSDDKLERFERRCLSYLEHHFPERAAWPDPNDAEPGLAEVHLGVEAASLRGCRTEGEVVKYLYLRALLGSDFDLNPGSNAVAALMNDGSLPIEERLERSFMLLGEAIDKSDGAETAAVGARFGP